LHIRTHRQCTLTGPLRLQARSDAGSWADVREDETPARVRGWAPAGDVGPQTAARLKLDRSTTYYVDLAWAPTLTPCEAAADMRVAGPRLAVPMPHLVQWCGEPVTVSNTFTPQGVSFGHGS
jgi:hypothetical protein